MSISGAFLGTHTFLAAASLGVSISNAQHGEEAAVLGDNPTLAHANRIENAIRLVSVLTLSPALHKSAPLVQRGISYLTWVLLAETVCRNMFESFILDFESKSVTDAAKEVTQNFKAFLVQWKNTVDPILALASKLTPLVLTINALATIRLVETSSETLGPVSLALTLGLGWLFTHNKLPTALNLPVSKMFWGLELFVNVFSPSLPFKIYGTVSATIDLFHYFTQIRRSQLTDSSFPSKLTKERVREVVERNVNYRVSRDHFTISPSRPFSKEEPDHLLSRFDDLFDGETSFDPEKAARRSKLTVPIEESKAYKAAKAANDALILEQIDKNLKSEEKAEVLTPLKYAKLLLKNLVDGIRNESLPSGQGLSYANIQSEYGYINEQMPTLDVDRATTVLTRFILETGEKCAQSPFHHVGEVFHWLYGEEGNSLVGKILTHLQGFRFGIATTTLHEDNRKAKQNRLDILANFKDSIAEQKLGKIDDLHRVNGGIRISFAYFGMPIHSFGDTSFAENPLIAFFYSQCVMASRLKKEGLYEMANILEFLDSNLRTFQKHLSKWLYSNQTIKEYYSEQFNAPVDSLNDDNDEYISWLDNLESKKVLTLLLLDLGIFIPMDAPLTFQERLVDAYDQFMKGFNEALERARRR